MAKEGEVVAKWLVVDATNKVLGRLATRVAMILMGKHRPEYTPHVDTGDFVVVINAGKVKLTGRKIRQKAHQRYSKYPGGLKVLPFTERIQTNPDLIIREAVRRMLPKNKIGVHMLSKLKVYSGTDHPHQAQQPQALEI
jgi:large subunit ribosomal protein L13